MGGVFIKMQLKIFTSLGCIRIPTGVQWCKSEGLKDKLTPHSYILLVCQGGKICMSSVLMEKLPPELLHHFVPFDRTKRCKSGLLICLIPP